MSEPIFLHPKRFSEGASFGFRVFPIRPRGKIPAVSWTNFKQQAASSELISEWDASECNVGVICGPASGIAVIDIDSPEAQSFYEALELPATPCVKTAKGFHYYYRYPVEGVRNRVGVEGMQIDVRGDGGYVVGAGSVHESGILYEWVCSPNEVVLAEMPETLLNLVGNSPPAHAKHPKCIPALAADTSTEANRFTWILEQRIAEKIERLEKAKEGHRNDTLFKVAVSLANDVAGARANWGVYAARLRLEAVKLGLAEEEVDRTLASAWRNGSSKPTEWMNAAHEWVYLSNPQIFLHLESGNSLRRQGFNSAFAGSWLGKGFLDNFLFKFSLIEIFYDVTYDPVSGKKIILKDGLRYWNSYHPSNIQPEKGDATPFIEFLDYLVPEELEKSHLLKMIAWTVRNPGKKLRHALLLRSARQGVGKSMLIDIWGTLLGERNVRKTTTEEMNSSYQAYVKETLLVVVEELNWGFGPTAYNNLKELITGDVARVNEKYLPQRDWPNHASFAFLTNIQAPIMIEEHDRRIFYINSPAEPKSKEYYGSFARWWKSNLQTIRWYMDLVDLSTFDPYAPPPMTVAKRDLIVDSSDDLTIELATMIELRKGPFGRDIVTLDEVASLLGPLMRFKSQRELRRALTNLGAKPLGQQRVSGTWIGEVFADAPKRESLWAIRHVSFWEDSIAVERAREFGRTVGMLAAFDAELMPVIHGKRWPGGEDAFLQQFKDD